MMVSKSIQRHTLDSNVPNANCSISTTIVIPRAASTERAGLFVFELAHARFASDPLVRLALSKKSWLARIARTIGIGWYGIHILLTHPIHHPVLMCSDQAACTSLSMKHYHFVCAYIRSWIQNGDPLQPKHNHRIIATIKMFKPATRIRN